MGVCLTLNFTREGGYSGVDDYRWAILRDRMPPVGFQAFNLFFNVIYWYLLRVLITIRALTLLSNQLRLGVLDGVVAVAFVLFLIEETVAGQ